MSYTRPIPTHEYRIVEAALDAIRDAETMHEVDVAVMRAEALGVSELAIAKALPISRFVERRNHPRREHDQ